MKQRHGKIVWMIMTIWLLGVCGLATATETNTAPAAQLKLRWEIERTEFTPAFPDGRTLAVLTLTNLGAETLPAQGWALFFNCISGVETGPSLDGDFAIERVVGTLFRLRPNVGFKPLASGQSTQLRIIHSDPKVSASKAPSGPYLVYEREPAVGLAIVDYRAETPTRPEQLRLVYDSREIPLVSAETLFSHYQAISDVPEEALPPVFPTPLHFERRPGTLHWSSVPRILAAPVLKGEVTLAKILLKPYFAATQTHAAEPGLRLLIGPIKDQTSAEAYELVVDPLTGVTLTGNSARGVVLGLQSLRELLPLQSTPAQGVTLPAWAITDAPRFEYRGLMLDVARNFHPKATVLRLLDLMARYKLNKLHLHLADDEGWRIEIPGLPELTAVGARRGHTIDGQDHLPPAYGSGPDVNDALGSGFYTQADFLEILRYATVRHIEVIPEIEMPGHARAAIKAMESRWRKLQEAGDPNARRYLLSDPDDKSLYRSPQLYTDNALNAGLPSTYAFIEHVVTELVSMYRKAGAPLSTLHVGGDELSPGVWEKSPAAQAAMQRLKLTSTVDLWDHFYDRVDHILRKQGLVASGWQELGLRKVKLHGDEKLIPNPFFAVRGFNLYVWNDCDNSDPIWNGCGHPSDLAYRLANAGFGVVLTPAPDLYFDLTYNRNPGEPGHNWAGYTDLDAIFDIIPFDYSRSTPSDPSTRIAGLDGLTDYGQRNFLGIEATLFTETVRSRDRMDYMLMPRMLALAERAWAQDPAWTRETEPKKALKLHDADWSLFVNQLGKHVLPKLDVEYPGVQYRIPLPGLKIVDGRVFANLLLPGFTLRYTTDGSEPTINSPIVAGPITDKGNIQVAAFNSQGRRGNASRIENR